MNPHDPVPCESAGMPGWREFLAKSLAGLLVLNHSFGRLFAAAD